MNKQPSRITRTTGLLGITLAVLLNSPVPVYAENGLIVLTRQVQPRAATRTELVPDPNPLAVQAGVPKYANTELSDDDFAHVNTGLSVSNRVLTGQPNSLTTSNSRTQSAGNAMIGMDASLGGGSTAGATGGISGRVNGAIKAGLRPLQQLGGGGQ